MPKDKAPKRATKARVEKKKKGNLTVLACQNHTDTTVQIQTHQREVSLLTCSLPMTNVTPSVRRTQESLSVCQPASKITSAMLTVLVGQVGKQLGEKWKGLTDKQKAPYEAKAAEDKKRYEKEKANYQVWQSPLPLYCTY